MQIVTVAVNPCIDKSTSIPELAADKKLRCTEPVLEPGGGGINVARAITKLGGGATVVYLSGGYYGGLISRLLTAERVPHLAMPINNDTRENLIILDTLNNTQYRFCMPGPYVTQPEWQQCLQSLQAITGVKYIVASGSLAPGVPTDFFALMARQARMYGVKLIVDTSGEGLKAALQEGVYMVKPNMAELSEYRGMQQMGLEEARFVCRELVLNGKCSVVLLSLGEAGAMLVTKDVSKHIAAPRIKKLSTVGAGDSMTAGMVLKLACGWDEESAATYAVACGTAATMHPGTQLCDVENADALYENMRPLLKPGGFIL